MEEKKKFLLGPRTKENKIPFQGKIKIIPQEEWAEWIKDKEELGYIFQNHNPLNQR